MLSAINPRLPQDLWNRKLNALSEILICLGYSIYYFECTLMVQSTDYIFLNINWRT